MPEKDKEKKARDILNEVASFQENHDAFQLMVQLENGMTASEIIDFNDSNVEKKEDIRNESLNQIADIDEIGIKHYNKTMIKGYPALISQLNQLRYDMNNTFGQRERTSEKTLQFLRDAMQALKMMNDADEVNRLSKITNIDGEQVKLSVNPYEVDSQLAYWTGYLNRMKNVDISTEKPFALDFAALGLDEIKNDLDASMKHSHSARSVKMQDTLNAFMESVNGAKRPYTKDQILAIDKSLKDLQDATLAYCEYKNKENPTSGTGADRLQIANRLLRATSGISGRVTPYVREELARAIANTQRPKVTRYEAVSPEEFERRTAAENASVVAERTLPNNTYSNYNAELSALIKKYPNDATLKELQAKCDNLLKAEADYSSVHSRNAQITFEKARDGFLPEVDKYITSLQTAGLKKGEEDKLTFADKFRTTLITHQAMDLLRPDRDVCKRVSDKEDALVNRLIKGFDTLGLKNEANEAVPRELNDIVRKAGMPQSDRAASVGAQMLAVGRVKLGQYKDDPLKAYDDQDFINKCAKEYLEFVKNNQLFPDGDSTIRPEMTPQIHEALKQNAEVYKTWAEALTNRKIEGKTSGKSYDELVDYYKNLQREALEFSQTEENIKKFADDYFKHWGGFDKYEEITAKQNILQTLGYAAKNISNPEINYETRAVSKLMFDDLLEKYSGKKVSEIDPYESKAYELVLSGISGEMKKHSAACERYINGCATAKDVVDLKKAYKEALDLQFKGVYEIVKSDNYRENTYRENRAKKICGDMMDRYIKDLENDKKINPNDPEHARDKLIAVLKDPKRRAKLCSEMIKNKEIQNMSKSNEIFEGTKLSELASKHIKAVVEANKSSKAAENVANKNVQKQQGVAEKDAINNGNVVV